MYDLFYYKSLVDDYCGDTPRAGHLNGGCPTGMNSCWLWAGDDMIENYMDYTNDACKNIFTQDQKTRIRTVMQVSPRRVNLLSSEVHLPTNKPIAYFTANQTEACSGSTINFTDLSVNNPTSWLWSFFDGTGTNVGNFTSQNPNLTFNTAGLYSARLIATNSFGNDTLYYPNYISILSNSILTFPFNENFEGGTVLPNWISYNPDGDREWYLSNTISAYGVGSKSAYFDNYSYADDPSGTIDALISSKIDFSANQNSYITFDVAYARFSKDYADTLVLYYSIDCGQNFYPFWVKGGEALATAGDNTGSFVPNSSEWRSEQISLQFLNGQSNVHIAIANYSGWGNNVYIDNIAIFIPSIPFKSASTSHGAGEPPLKKKSTISVKSEIFIVPSELKSPRNWQQVSQASPIPSLSESVWSLFTIVGQLSQTSPTSSPSKSD